MTNDKNSKIDNGIGTNHEDGTASPQNAEVRQRRRDELKRKR